MSLYLSLNSFNAGELSPKMLGRNDVSQYGKGCERLLNFFVTPYGSVERRPGTRDLGAAKYQNMAVRLVRFVYSSTDSYICEFGNHYVRFWKDGAPVMNGQNPLEIETVYASNELDSLKWIQSADVMTLVHPAHPVYEMRRTDSNTFTLMEKTWEYPPMLDPNLEDDLKITPSAVDGSITLTASGGNIFRAQQIGGFFELMHMRQENVINKTFDSSTNPHTSSVAYSGELEVKGYWSFVTHGTWSGNVTIQRSYDNKVTWKDYLVYNSVKDSNFSTSGTEEDDGVFYRVKMTNYSQSDTGTLKACKIMLSNPDFTVTGVVRITGITSTITASNTVYTRYPDGDTSGVYAWKNGNSIRYTASEIPTPTVHSCYTNTALTAGGSVISAATSSATANVTKKLGGTDATNEWNEGAFSELRGFPCSVAYYEERMMFGGTKYRPQTVWGSKTGDWDNYLLGDKDDDGLEFTLSSDTVNEIRWMCQHNALVIGTADSEWTLSASSSDSALTPTNFQVKRQSVYGTSRIPAQMAGETILFVQRGARKVREFVYSWEKEGYNCPDMTILADHITTGGVLETALMQLPDTILWCLLSNGTLAALTYERDQEVVGWHRHELAAGSIVSIEVIPNGNEDELYLAANLDGVIRILKMESRNSQFYVDYGKTITQTSQDYATGLTHLAGKTVQVVADGALQRSKTVSNAGRIDLDEAATEVVAGLGYTSELTTMPLEIEMQNGQSLLRKKTVGEIRLRYYNSIGGEAKSGESEWQTIMSRDMIFDNMDSPITLKSEVSLLNPFSGFSAMANVSVRQKEPFPFNLTAVVVTYEVTEQ